MWGVILGIVFIFIVVMMVKTSLEMKERKKLLDPILEELLLTQESDLNEDNLNEEPLEYIRGNIMLDNYFEEEKGVIYGEELRMPPILSTPSLRAMLIKYIVSNKIDGDTLASAYKRISNYAGYNNKMVENYTNNKVVTPKFVALGVKNDNLIICNFVAPLNAKLQIPLKNVISYSREGDIFNETHISGGGGGGSSLSGAIVGGVVAGGAGAIIGSRKKVEEIKSENVINDKRTTILEYKVDDVVSFIFFGSEVFDTFLKLIPNKEFKFVRREQLEYKDVESNTDEILNQIKTLSDLKEKGILTEQEFVDKKKLLLDKI